MWHYITFYVNIIQTVQSLFSSTFHCIRTQWYMTANVLWSVDSSTLCSYNYIYIDATAESRNQLNRFLPGKSLYLRVSTLDFGLSMLGTLYLWQWCLVFLIQKLICTFNMEVYGNWLVFRAEKQYQLVVFGTNILALYFSPGVFFFLSNIQIHSLWT